MCGLWNVWSAVMAGLLAAAPLQAQSDKTTRTVSGVQKFEGRLADGTPYRLQKPSNWNGILVSDLDGIEDGDTETYYLLLKAGYGTTSVMRRSYDRAWILNRYATSAAGRGALQREIWQATIQDCLRALRRRRRHAAHRRATPGSRGWCGDDVRHHGFRRLCRL